MEEARDALMAAMERAREKVKERQATVDEQNAAISFHLKNISIRLEQIIKRIAETQPVYELTKIFCIAFKNVFLKKKRIGNFPQNRRYNQRRKKQHGRNSGKNNPGLLTSVQRNKKYGKAQRNKIYNRIYYGKINFSLCFIHSHPKFRKLT